MRPGCHSQQRYRVECAGTAGRGRRELLWKGRERWLALKLPGVGGRGGNYTVLAGDTGVVEESRQTVRAAGAKLGFTDPEDTLQTPLRLSIHVQAEYQATPTYARQTRTLRPMRMDRRFPSADDRADPRTDGLAPDPDG